MFISHFHFLRSSFVPNFNWLNWLRLVCLICGHSGGSCSSSVMNRRKTSSWNQQLSAVVFYIWVLTNICKYSDFQPICNQYSAKDSSAAAVLCWTDRNQFVKSKAVHCIVVFYVDGYWINRQHNWCGMLSESESDKNENTRRRYLPIKYCNYQAVAWMTLQSNCQWPSSEGHSVYMCPPPTVALAIIWCKQKIACQQCGLYGKFNKIITCHSCYVFTCIWQRHCYSGYW